MPRGQKRAQLETAMALDAAKYIVASVVADLDENERVDPRQAYLYRLLAALLTESDPVSSAMASSPTPVVGEVGLGS